MLEVFLSSGRSTNTQRSEAERDDDESPQADVLLAALCTHDESEAVLRRSAAMFVLQARLQAAAVAAVRGALRRRVVAK